MPKQPMRVQGIYIGAKWRDWIAMGRPMLYRGKHIRLIARGKAMAKAHATITKTMGKERMARLVRLPLNGAQDMRAASATVGIK
jgi:hypothetical protein